MPLDSRGEFLSMTLTPVCKTQRTGKNFGIFSSLDSTNNYVKRGASVLCDGYTVVAREQLSGRGRQGKSFYSPDKDGLYMSILFKNDKALNDELFTVKACLAVCFALNRMCGIENTGKIGIKWVNDVYFGDKKLCGILCERFNDGDGNMCIAAGFGINFRFDNESAPAELKEIVASVYDITHTEYDRILLCGLICEEIERLVCDEAFSKEEILEIYKKYSVVIGKEINILREGQPPVRAAALDICEDGGLLVRTADGFTKKLCGGEISIRVKK